MRITRELLLKIAQETIQARARSERDVLCACLYGSMLGEDPLLGGAADIDLLLVTNGEPLQPREITALSEQVHLDIQRMPRSLFRQARQLRQDPWIGPLVFAARPLHDPQHFWDFTQATVRGQFDRPENVIERARQLAGPARQAWFSLHSAGEYSPGAVQTYLLALENAANAIASLNGAPLTTRRFMLEFPGRAERVGQPRLAAALAGLLDAGMVKAEQVRGWLPAWSAAFGSAQANSPVDFHPARRGYLQMGIEGLLEGSAGAPAALWVLVTTWTQAAALTDEPEVRQAWEQAVDNLNLGAAGFPRRLDGLDAFLDQVEEALETWARKNGVS